jgi:AraC-like DNA-binding protein
MTQNSELKPDWPPLFLEGVTNAAALFDVFDYFSEISLFIKDTQSRYVKINQTMAEVFGLRTPDEIVGKTDFDFFPPAIAARYVEEDQQLFKSRKPILNRQNFMPGPRGLPFWYSYSKIPLFKADQVVGVAGFKYACETNFDNESNRHHRLYKVIRYVATNYQQGLEVSDLAAQAGLSISQLQREFRREFGINPNRYIQEVRIGVARHLLKTTNLSMAAISEKCGYYDQSHFCRQFKSSTGLSPLNYRATYFRASR